MKDFKLAYKSYLAFLADYEGSTNENNGSDSFNEDRDFVNNEDVE